MSVRRLIKQNSSSNCVDECDNPTSLAYSHPIYDNQMDNKNIHTVAHRVESLPRTRKKVSLSRSHSFMDNSGLQRYVPPNRNMQSLHLEAAWTPSQSQSLQPVCLNRRMLVLVKQDNETFGFEIQTSRLQHLHPYTLEMCTYVCKVHEHSPAYHAGLAVGDILANVNGISTEGFSHTETVDLIKSSGNFLRVETLNGTIIRRSELEAKLHVLKKNLHEKWAELQSLLLQEQRLVHGKCKENDCSIDDSLELLEKGFSRSPSSLRSAFLNKHRFSSDSSCKSRLSSMTEDSEDGFYQMPVFDDSASETLSRQTSEDEECFFAKDSGAPPKNPSLTRNRSISLASSGSGPSSPLWDTCSLSNVFGTLPRKSRRGSVRRHILKFIPGLHKSVEEEESCV